MKKTIIIVVMSFVTMTLGAQNSSDILIRVFHFLVPKSHKYLKINSKSIAHVNIYRYICTRKYNLTWHSEDR